jgi:glutamine---fructose-6-phosphate transaminase (isomerizing)
MAKANPMRDEVFSLPTLIREQIPVLDDRIRTAFSFNDLLSIQQIVLTGCGDSYYAGLGSNFFFNKLCGIPTFGLNAMSAGRYFLFDSKPAFPNNPLVMATSVSGRVTRTVEAMEMAKHIGAMTVAITGNPEAPLAQAAKHVIDCTIDPVPNPDNVPIPGVRSYRMTLLVHFLFAIHLAEVKEKINTEDGDALRKNLLQTADAIEATLAASEKNVMDLVDTFAEEKYFLFVGDGPHRATAEFSAAKVIEAAGLTAYGQDTEEWAHIQYYENVLPATPTFVFCSGNRSHDRVIDLVPYMKDIGRTVVGILSENCAEAHTHMDHVLPVKGDTPELFAQMVYPVLPELFSTFLAQRIGVPSFRTDDPRYTEKGNLRLRDTDPITPSDLKKML